MSLVVEKKILQENRMNDINYERVNENESKEPHVENTGLRKAFSSPLFRQVLVCSTVWTSYFISGIAMGFPTIYIAQMRQEANSTAAISQEMSSWLTSTHSYSSLLWVTLWTTLSHYFGRRLPFVLAYIIMFTSYIVTYTSTTYSQTLVGEIFRGSGFACNIAVSVTIVAEYSSPKNRGIFLPFKQASLYWGLWVGNTIGTFMHWDRIILFAFVCFVYFITVPFWPESPQWLASKGRFEECEKAHLWIKGNSDDSKKELADLIAAQEDYLKGQQEETLCQKIISMVKIMRQKEFYKPILISLLVVSQNATSGKFACSMYALELLKKVMGNDQKAYLTMLIIDGATVAGMYLGCVLFGYVKRRTLLIATGALGALFLYLFSLYFFLIKLNVIEENYVISIGLLTIVSICVSSGPVNMGTSSFGELMPANSKNLFATVYTFLSFFMFGTVLKTAPYVFYNFSVYVTFLSYALSLTVTTYLIYKFLPETKDKTLLEINNSFSKKLPIIEKERFQMLST